MAAPKGNQYAIGNRGGGRPSAYLEDERAKILVDAFFGDLDPRGLHGKKRKSPWEICLIKCLEGNERILIAMLNKLFPDKLKYKLAEPDTFFLPTSEQRKEKLKTMFYELKSIATREGWD